jgi:hypothetical protein
MATCFNTLATPEGTQVSRFVNAVVGWGPHVGTHGQQLDAGFPTRKVVVAFAQCATGVCRMIWAVPMEDRYRLRYNTAVGTGRTPTSVVAAARHHESILGCLAR